MNKIFVMPIMVIFLFSYFVYGDELFDDSLEDLMSIETEVKAEVGSRDSAKDFLNTPFPIDVITSQQIESCGLTSLSDILRYFIAGFNAPETSVADGSDHIRTFTLRGMSPDQVLVLINGKRVHSSALLHVNGTIGRGSNNVDLDTIVPSSIERIEILRDGAAAQYGSDAIAGVINIILKGAHYQNSITFLGGNRTLKGDGTSLDSELFLSYPLAYDGFINFAFQTKSQQATNRAGKDHRINPPAVTTHVGLPDATNLLATLNTEMPQENGFVLYANSTLNYRNSRASTFFRPPNDDANVTLLYPLGFLPILNAKIFDYGLTTGVNEIVLDGFSFDISNTLGYNQINYYLRHSMNYSLGADSPTFFYNGGLEFFQNVSNIDIKKDYNQWSFAGGLEYRYESYSINAGDKASYIDGGAQGFPGYSNLSAVQADRTNYALYIDNTYKKDNAFIEGAVRYENYSDFGATTNFKVATSYQIDKVLLRTSISTGFRAPSLAQSYYSNIATFSGVRSGIFPTNAPIARLLGAKDLEAEKSQHFTFGGVYQPTSSSFLTIDSYIINVDDRIMLSNPQTLTQQQQNLYKIKEVSYFTNAVDTQTYGLDIKIDNTFYLKNNTTLNVGCWYNYNKNKITHFNTNLITRENSFEQIDRMENGQPKHFLKVYSTYKKERWQYKININGYGAYAQVINNKRYWFDKELTADVDISYQMAKNIKISFGGINIFNALPNKWDGLSGTYYGYDSIKPYSRYSPFGYSGAYYYAGIKINL